MLSVTCKTAVKAVIYLASKDSRAGIQEIAMHLQASEHTVGKFLQSLVKHGVINSAKGPSGGFYITDEQSQQPIMNIVEAIDGKEFFYACGLGLSKCSSNHPCPIHFEYEASRKLLENLFRKKKISDLCKPVNKGIAYLFG